MKEERMDTSVGKKSYEISQTEIYNEIFFDLRI